MNLPSLPVLGGLLGAALAGADPAATQQLQQLAAPAADAAAKAADLQSQAAAAAGNAAGPAEAATANAAEDLGNAFSSATPTGLPAVPCACGDCIKGAVDPALPAKPGV